MLPTVKQHVSSCETFVLPACSFQVLRNSIIDPLSGKTRKGMTKRDAWLLVSLWYKLTLCYVISLSACTITDNRTHRCLKISASCRVSAKQWQRSRTCLLWVTRGSDFSINGSVHVVEHCLKQIWNWVWRTLECTILPSGLSIRIVQELRNKALQIH
jgi:hypothetical protein